MRIKELTGNITVVLNEKGLLDVYFSLDEGRIVLIEGVSLGFGDRVQIKGVTMEFEVFDE